MKLLAINLSLLMILFISGCGENRTAEQGEGANGNLNSSITSSKDKFGPIQAGKLEFKNNKYVVLTNLERIFEHDGYTYPVKLSVHVKENPNGVGPEYETGFGGKIKSGEKLFMSKIIMEATHSDDSNVLSHLSLKSFYLFMNEQKMIYVIIESEVIK